MTNPTYLMYDYTMIDCRSCANYNTMRGRCHSTVKCVNADMYKPKPVIQLWIVENEKDRN